LDQIHVLETSQSNMLLREPNPSKENASRKGRSGDLRNRFNEYGRKINNNCNPGNPKPSIANPLWQIVVGSDFIDTSNGQTTGVLKMKNGSTKEGSESHTIRNPLTLWTESKFHEFRVVHDGYSSRRNIHQGNKEKKRKDTKNRKNENVNKDSLAPETIGNTQHTNPDDDIHETNAWQGKHILPLPASEGIFLEGKNIPDHIAKSDFSVEFVRVGKR
jgi:hypothetical protein